MDSNNSTYCFFMDSDGFTSAPEQCLSELTDPTVKEIASRFAKNFDDITELAALPLKLASIGLTGQRETMNFMSACMRSGHSATKYGKEPQATRAINDEMAKVRSAEETQKWMDEHASDLVTNLFQREDMQPTNRILMFSLLSASWTLFEALSGDLWIAVVNGRPVQLGSYVIANLSDQHDGGEIESRGISLKVLAQHNFDLSKGLGILLSKRFDFTSLSGVRRAYKSTFSAINLNIFDNSELKMLQAYRHAIVHRAGIADRTFVETSKLENATIGNPVPLEGRSAEVMIGAAAECGAQLIKTLDDWLKRHPVQG